VDQQALHHVEYLNSLKLSGLLPHQLNIKVGALIMLLRNMDPVRGHCNGTRYVVWQVSRRYIEAEIACGEYTGNVLFIPQIPVAYRRQHVVYTASLTVPHPASIHHDNK